ncbi:MAG: hypothetical protein WAN36_14855, partial [Calditrichia bacterium]
MNPVSLLNIVTYLPLLGVVLLLMLPKTEERLIKGWAFLVSLLTFLLSLPLFFYFQEGISGIKF